MVSVYHPKGNDGHAFANIAFTGFIGSITGLVWFEFSKFDLSRDTPQFSAYTPRLFFFPGERRQGFFY